jgi:hypothetical protein
MAFFFKVISVLTLIIIIFNGCATPNISKETTINKNEGILVTKIHSNIAGLEIFITGEKSIFYLAKISGPKEYLKIIPLKSGKAFFWKIKFNISYVELDPYYFDIEPNSITYVGDLFINWVKNDYAQVNISDRENETISEAKKEYPWIFDKLPYRKSLADMKIDSIEGLEQIDELKKLKEKRKE